MKALLWRAVSESFEKLQATISSVSVLEQLHVGNNCGLLHSCGKMSTTEPQIHFFTLAQLKRDCRITKFFRVVTPTTETSSGSTGSRNPSGGHVSDSDTSDSDEPEDRSTVGGDTDAGPNQVEQSPGVQPDSDGVNGLGLILRGAMTDIVYRARPFLALVLRAGGRV